MGCRFFPFMGSRELLYGNKTENLGKVVPALVLGNNG